MYAHLWGYCRQGRETEYVHVDRIGVCVSAKAKKDQVKLSKDVITLQDDIVKRWSPHVSLLEDFHTHPWESRKELRRFRGWNFSDTDKDSFLADDELWKHAGDNPITLVMAVTKLQRVRKSQTKQLRQQHRGQFNIGQYRFSISARAGRLNRKGRRKFGHKDVTLLLGQYFHNEAGSRVWEE